MAARRSELTETLLGHPAGIFPNAVVSDNYDKLFVINTRDNAPGDRYDSHKKISNDYTNIRVDHRTQRNKHAVFPQALGLQSNFEIF